MKGLVRSLRRGAPQLQEVVRTIIPVRNKIVNVAAAAAGVGFGTVVLGGLPQGNILLLGALSYLQFAGPVGGSANLVDTWSGDYALGTAPDADGTLAGSEVDLVPSTAVGPAVAELSPRTRGANAVQVMLDNTDGSLEINLNMLVDAADITDASNVNLTVNGELALLYSVLMDD